MVGIGQRFEEALSRRVLLLDGATGTELERRGVPTPAPLWSAAALFNQPHVVAAIHRDYAAAGAEIIVANTFRSNVRALRAAGRLSRGAELARLAVQLARQAVAEPDQALPDHRPGTGRFVAASVGPVEDCYSPELVPDEATLDGEHAELLGWLKAAGPDLIWIETMNTVREARAAARAAAAGGLPFVVCFVLREDGALLSGEPLDEAVPAVEPFGPLAVGLNCIPPRALATHLPRLRKLTDLALVAYAHINNAEPLPGWSYAQHVGPTEYAACAREWVELGAAIVGGCCGTTPAHIRALRDAL